jgi:hypothetical protein
MPLTPTEERVLNALDDNGLPPSVLVKQLSSTGVDSVEDVRAAIWHLIDVRVVDLTPELLLKARDALVEHELNA